MLKEVPLGLAILCGAILICITQSVRKLKQIVTNTIIEPSFYLRRANEALARLASRNRLLWLLLLLPRGLATALITVCAHSIERLCSRTAVRCLYLQRAMDDALTYQDWLRFARAKEDLNGATAWRADNHDRTLDVPLLQARLLAIEQLIAARNFEGLMTLLRNGMSRNFGGMGEARLYSASQTGTKFVIERFNDALVEAIAAIAATPAVAQPAKLAFLNDLYRIFGRSAMLLSGGGRFGINHTGVLKELFERDLLPRIISGSSVGAMAAAVCARYTDEEARTLPIAENLNLNIFDAVSEWATMAQRLVTRGVLMDARKLERAMMDNLSNLTFAEAHRRTARVVNVMVTGNAAHQQPRMLNYLTAPDVVLYSAAMASCAIPFVFESVSILKKDPATGVISPWLEESHRWSDGSLVADMPAQRLAELFNVNFTVASQLNPHVVPFLAWGASGWYAPLKYLVVSEITHRIAQAQKLELFPAVLQPLLRLIDQRYEGDVTIWPSLGLWDYLNIARNPSREDVVAGTLAGRRSVWPHLSRIREQCRVEFALERAIARLQPLPGS